MKVIIISLGAGMVLVLGEAMGMVALQSTGVTPPLLQYWGPLTAFGVGLIGFATLRTTVAALKADAATKSELAGLAKVVDMVHADVKHLRELIETRLSA
jgi:hypothetical protein